MPRYSAFTGRSLQQANARASLAGGCACGPMACEASRRVYSVVSALATRPKDVNEITNARPDGPIYIDNWRVASQERRPDRANFSNPARASLNAFNDQLPQIY